MSTNYYLKRIPTEEEIAQCHRLLDERKIDTDDLCDEKYDSPCLESAFVKKEGYSLICKVRDIFKRKLTIDEAKQRLHEWYKDVNICTLREIKAARDCIKSKEAEVLNYFVNRATNASAESLNSKMKGFRAQLHGIADIPFFMYRICTIFG